ncbi:MAG: exo-beta-N-acetylmuramidase NamZ domain-containing protein, partial [Bacteroidota bacterium]
IVYGMTYGEYALMVNGEGWLPGKKKCDLTVVKVKNYNHEDFYQLPVKPSPNLPNMMSVYLYPSLGLFEGTVVSMGRGTDAPFQIIGHPQIKNKQFSFTPLPG